MTLLLDIIIAIGYAMNRLFIAALSLFLILVTTSYIPIALAEPPKVSHRGSGR